MYKNNFKMDELGLAQINEQMIHGSENNVRSGQKETLAIPADGLSLKYGFSFDIGGSLIKIVHATDEGDTVRLHFMSYPREVFLEAIAYIKQEIGDKLSKSSTVKVCGVGFQQHLDDVERMFGVKVKVLNEFECFTDAYRFLVLKLPTKDLYHDISKSTREFIEKDIEQQVSVMKTIEQFDEEGKSHTWEMGTDADSNSFQDNPTMSHTNQTIGGSSTNDFPVMMCILGSAAAALKLETDGTYGLKEINTRCGRTFLGLGMMMTAAKNYDELISLATSGDYAKLHVLGKHLKTGAVGNFYSHIPDDMLCYLFGHCMNLDIGTVQKEDMAAALLAYTCQDLGQSMHQAAMTHNVRKMVFCGGFPGSSQVVRDEIAKHLGMRCVYNSQGIKYEYRFLKYGGYYGAMGALLKTLTEG